MSELNGHCGDGRHGPNEDARPADWWPGLAGGLAAGLCLAALVVGGSLCLGAALFWFWG